MSLDRLGPLNARVVENRVANVVVEHHVPRVDLAGPNRRRVTRQHRHADRRLVHQPLVKHAEFAEEEPVVAGVDDERVLSKAFVVEVIEHAAHVVVDPK